MNAHRVEMVKRQMVVFFILENAAALSKYYKLTSVMFVAYANHPLIVRSRS